MRSRSFTPISQSVAQREKKKREKENGDKWREKKHDEQTKKHEDDKKEEFNVPCTLFINVRGNISFFPAESLFASLNLRCSQRKKDIFLVLCFFLCVCFLFL